MHVILQVILKAWSMYRRTPSRPAGDKHRGGFYGLTPLPPTLNVSHVQFWHFMGVTGFMVSSFQRYGIFTFKVSEFHGCGRFHGFIVSRISETIWA